MKQRYSLHTIWMLSFRFVTICLGFECSHALAGSRSSPLIMAVFSSCVHRIYVPGVCGPFINPTMRISLSPPDRSSFLQTVFPQFLSMASGFVAGTTQNIIGGAVGGAVGSSGGSYLEKHTIAGLSNGAADYRSKGVLLFETYSSKLTITEFDDIRERLAEYVRLYCTVSHSCLIASILHVLGVRLRWRTLIMTTGSLFTAGLRHARRRLATEKLSDWSGLVPIFISLLYIFLLYILHLLGS